MLKSPPYNFNKRFIYYVMTVFLFQFYKLVTTDFVALFGKAGFTMFLENELLVSVKWEQISLENKIELAVLY